MASPYDSLLDPEAGASPKASPYDALLEQKSPYDALLDKPAISDPIEHGAAHWGNPSEQENAFNAYREQSKQPVNAGSATGRFFKGLGTTLFPSQDEHGEWHWPLASGAMNLVKGTAQTAKNIADTSGAPDSFTKRLSAVSPLAGSIGAMWNEDPTASRAGRQLATGTELGVMNAATMAENLRRNASGLAGTVTGGVVGNTQAQLSDADLRGRFQNDVLYRYLTQQAQQGRMIPEALSGNEIGVTPQQLDAQGKPISPEEIENIGTATNPANLVELGALTNPVSRGVMSPLVKGAGAVATGAANILDKAHLGSAARAAGILESIYHGNPLGAAVGVAAPLASKALSSAGRGAGNILTQAGEEMAGGAIPLGQSTATKVAKEAIKGAAGSVPTGAAFAATGGTPEGAGSQAGFAIGLGGLLSATGAIPKAGKSGAIERVAAGQQLAKEGAAANYGVGFDDWHNEAMQSVNPADTEAINKYRGFLDRLRTADGAPIQVYAVKGDKFSEVQRKLGEVDVSGNPTNPNGRGLISPDGSQIFVNVDAKGNAGDTLGHETGHAADLVGKYADALLHQSLQSSIAKHLYTADAQGNVLPTKEFADFMDSYQKSVGAKSMSRKEFEAEYVAETARKILGGQNIENFTLPKSLSDKMGEGVSDFLNTIGVKPGDGKLGFNGKEIQSITRNVSDLLRETGKAQQGFDTSAQYRLDQLKQTIANRPKANATVAELDAYAAARKEYDDLTKKQAAAQAQPFPASGAPPVRPSAPVAPPSRTANQTRVAASLRLNGLTPTEAAQWASVAQGDTVEAMIVDALQKRAQQKFPNSPATPVQSTPNVQTPTPANESVPTVSGKTEPVSSVAVQETPNVTHEPTPVLPDGNPETTPETVDHRARVKALVDTAEERARWELGNSVAVKPEGMKLNTKDGRAWKKEQESAGKEILSNEDAEQRVTRAKIDAVLSDIGDDKTGLHREIDDFGNETIVGDYDPSNPQHEALANIGGGVSAKDAATLQGMQANKGRILYAKYRSALSNAEQSKALTGEATRENADTSMTTRRREYQKDPSSERDKGTIQSKVIIPIGTEMKSPSGTILARFVTLDNLLHNVRSIFEGLPSIGRENPYGNDPARQEALLVRDAQAYAENHANGYRGDGSAPMTRFPDSGLPAVKEGYQPVRIPADRFALLNMAFHSEGAGKLGDLLTRRDALAEQGKELPKASKAQLAKAQESYALGKENAPWVDPQSGETNQLRAELKAAGFDTKNKLKPPFETLSPDHILETSDQPLPVKEGEIATVRPHGFTIDPAKLAEKGLPQNKAVSAGFLPSESTPGKEPTAGASGEPLQPVQSEHPSSGVTSKQDTQNPVSDNGSPEAGSSPGERLAREAEQAGVVLSISVLKGLIQEDPATMERIRARIQQNTGSAAKFLPGTVQTDWMAQQAKDRGFDSLNAFVTQQPDEFRKLVSQWRSERSRLQSASR